MWETFGLIIILKLTELPPSQVSSRRSDRFNQCRVEEHNLNQEEEEEEEHNVNNELLLLFCGEARQFIYYLCLVITTLDHTSPSH